MSNKFSDIVGDLEDKIDSIETYQSPVFGFLNVLIINRTQTQWFIAKEVANSLGYNTDRVDRIIKRYVQPSEIRILKTANMPDLNSVASVSKRGKYILTENGVFQLVLNSPLKNAIEYKVWVSEIVRQVHHTGIYKCEINEANTKLNDLFKTSTIPRFDISLYQQGAYIDVVSLNPYGEQEIDNNYKLRIINLAFFLVFHQTYSNLDPQSIYTGDIKPFDIAYKFGGSELVSILINNIQFILGQLTCNCSLIGLENWVYGFYPIDYTPKYNINNREEIQKLLSNNNTIKEIKDI